MINTQALLELCQCDDVIIHSYEFIQQTDQILLESLEKYSQAWLAGQIKNSLIQQYGFSDCSQISLISYMIVRGLDLDLVKSLTDSELNIFINKTIYFMMEYTRLFGITDIQDIIIFMNFNLTRD